MHRTSRMVVLLGLVVGMAPLARIENLAFSVFLVALLSVYGLWRVDWFTTRSAYLTLAPFLTITILFLSTSYLVFDTPFPVSGLVKRWWVTQDPRFAEANDWLENFNLLMRIPAVRNGILSCGVGSVVLAVSWLIPRYRYPGSQQLYLCRGFVGSDTTELDGFSRPRL